jgi:hypothetical protein
MSLNFTNPDAKQDHPQNDFKFVFMVWVLSRLWFAFFAYLGHISHPFQEKIIEAYSGVSNWYLNVWTTFDSQYFLEIARNGYTPKSSAFFPLYPFLLRPFGPDENTMALAGFFISNVAFLVALWIFWKLSLLQFERGISRVMLWTLAFFPAAVYSMAVYTESLFIMFALGAFYLARTRQWHWAIPCAVLAALTRNAGPVLAIALLMEWWGQRKNLHRESQSAIRQTPSLIWAFCALLPMLVFVGMQLHFRSTFGGLALLKAQESFGRAASLPWIPLWRDLADIFTIEPNLVTIWNVAASILTFYFGWKYRKRLAKADNLFMCGVMLMQLCFSRIWAPYTISSLRYVFSTTAFSQALALEMQAPSSRLAKLFLIATGLIFSAGFAFLFGTKAFIS